LLSSCALLVVPCIRGKHIGCHDPNDEAILLSAVLTHKHGLEHREQVAPSCDHKGANRQSHAYKDQEPLPSVDLLSSNGERVPNFYEQSSYRNVLGRIDNLSLTKIEEQSGWIKSSLLSNKKEEKYQIKHKKEIMSEQSFDKKLFIEEAEKIGNTLLEQAIYGEKNDATWISLETNYYGQWHVSPLDNSLYNGIGGITLFLSYLSNITQKEAYKDLADKALESILYTPAYSSDFFSAYFGKASDIYVLSQILAIHGKNSRIENVVNSRIGVISDNIKNNSHFDLLGGSAGIIQVLLNAYEQFGSTKALQAAQKYGQHLLENKVPMNKGIGWLDTNSNTCLGGFSHGTSGIAWSLLRLFDLTKQEEYLETALQAIAYDRSLFNHKHKNWNDLREDDMKAQEYSTAWCHGATGIGLSRLLYMDSLHDPIVEEEINQAITTTEAVGMGRSHCLCHGDLGNSELFLSAGLKFNEQKYINFAQAIGWNVIKEKNEKGKYATGVSNKIEIPGLFLGLSGIGYQLLRLAEPDTVPSILTLDRKK
jgi:type 2 lantibiotic biosynthesis protein LanM